MSGELELDVVHVGDCRDILARLPDESVDCVVTSPPYLGMRTYGGLDGEIGSEDDLESGG